MRKNLFRLVQRVFASREAADTYQADFDNAAEMVVVARALRSHGFGARFGETPLRLVVTIPKNASRYAVGGGSL